MSGTLFTYYLKNGVWTKRGAGAAAPEVPTVSRIWSGPASVDTSFVPPTAPRAGSRDVGTVIYAPPTSNVIYVSLTGSDSNNGLTPGAPKATIQAAVNACSDGWTIVLRGGRYLQKVATVVPAGKGITIQNYGSVALGVAEAVYVYGSKQQTSWTDLGDGTYEADLFAQFDHTMPGGYSGGVDPANPNPHWPDQAFINDVRLVLRPASEIPSANEFTVDYATNKIRIAQDPTSKTVEISNLDRFIVLRGANSVLRGFGIKRFATPITGSTGTVDVSANNFLAENMHLEDCGQQSMAFGPSADNGRVKDCTVRRASILGIMCNGVDNFTIENVLVELSNFSGWDNEPGAAGIKMARMTNSVVKNSVIQDNLSSGLWWDVSCYNVVVFNNMLKGNRGPAIEWEISRKVLLVNNWIIGAGTSTFWALDGGEVRLWNNMLDRGSAYDVRFEEDSRAGVVSTGENPQGLQDWRTDKAEVCNNILANYSNRNGTWRLYFANIAIAENASDYFRRVGGNVISGGTTSVARMAAVEDASGATPVYTTPGAFLSAMPSGKVGINKIDAFTVPTQSQLDAWAQVADSIPADVAALLGVTAGFKAVGPLVPAPIPR